MVVSRALRRHHTDPDTKADEPLRLAAFAHCGRQARGRFRTP